MTPQRTFIRVFALLLALATHGHAAAQAARGDDGLRGTEQSCAAVSAQTCDIARSLGRGINLGNMLDAPREGDWGVKFDPAYVDMVAGAFTTVRLPVRWSNHAAPTADATIDEAFARHVDSIVDALLARGLYVIVDLHHYTQISGDPPHLHEFTVDPSVVDVRLLNLWKQIAHRYKSRSPRLIFELLNEPHGRLNADAWNTLSARVLAEVRKTNPTRAVLIGPVEWNSVYELPKLHLPRDRNIIVAVHNYDPFPFTHQGVDFMPQFPPGPTCCDASQRKAIIDALDAASRWNEASGYPVHLGEFGTYEKADMKSRETYTRFVRDEAERRGIGWTYWEFASFFGVYSPKNGAWVEPIRRALLD